MVGIINSFRFAGVTGPAHRYWRIYINANGGASDVSIDELELYTQPYGKNEVGAGTATASSYNATVGTPFTPSRAFEFSLRDHGVSSTQDLWASGTTPVAGQWLAYDFGVGNAKEIVEIGMWGRLDSTFTSQTPTDFDVQYSDDGTTWTTSWSVTGLTWAAGEFKRLTKPSASRSYSGSPHGSHAYWRLYELRPQNSSRNVCGFAEMEMRATPGGSDQCSGGTATASTTFSGAGAANAFDNSASSVWSGSGANFEDWIRYQFAAPVSVGQISIKARNDSFFLDAPKWAAMQYSDDGAKWTTAWTITPVAWTTGSTQAFSDPAYV